MREILVITLCRLAGMLALVCSVVAASEYFKFFDFLQVK
jgi:hypothetical protein